MLALGAGGGGGGEIPVQKWVVRRSMYSQIRGRHCASRKQGITLHVWNGHNLA